MRLAICAASTLALLAPFSVARAADDGCAPAGKQQLDALEKKLMVALDCSTLGMLESEIAAVNCGRAFIRERREALEVDRSVRARQLQCADRRVATDAWNAFERQAKLLSSTRANCEKQGTCAELPILEEAVARSAISALQVLLPGDPRYTRLRSELISVLLSAADFEQVLAQLNKGLSRDQIGQLMSGIVSELARGRLSPDDMKARYELAVDLRDPRKRQMLSRVLQLSEEARPIAAKVKGLVDSPGGQVTDQQISAAIGSLQDAEATRLVLYMRGLNQFNSNVADSARLHVVVATYAVKHDPPCDSEQFSLTFQSLLNAVAPHGAGAAIKLKSPEELDGFMKRAGALLDGSAECTTSTSEFDEHLCKQGYAYGSALALRILDESPSTRVAEAELVLVKGQEAETRLPKITSAPFPGGCEGSRQRAAAMDFMVDASEKFTGFRRLPKLPPPEESVHVDTTTRQTPPRTSSAWYAAAFAGVPFLTDDRATMTSKIVPSVADAALLVAAGTAMGLSVKYRNDYSTDRQTTSLDSANRALGYTIAFAGGIVLTRVVSGLVYGHLPSWWQK